MQKQSNRSTGFTYEEKAVSYLKEKGYQILERNFYSRYGELDIIAQEGSYLVFVEVKYRKTARSGHPLEAVDKRKQSRMRNCAYFYLMRYGFPENTPCRFDVIGILGDAMTHIENAF